MRISSYRSPRIILLCGPFPAFLHFATLDYFTPSFIYCVNPMRSNVIASVVIVIAAIGASVLSAPIAYGSLQRRTPGGMLSVMFPDGSESDMERYLDNPALSAVALNQVQPYHISRLQEMIVDGPEHRRELALTVLKRFGSRDAVVSRVEELGFAAKSKDLFQLHGRAIKGDWMAILTPNVAAARNKANPAPGLFSYVMRALYEEGHGLPYNVRFLSSPSKIFVPLFRLFNLSFFFISRLCAPPVLFA
ncbi:hypothetical protein FRB94_006711 [Tulasnella sp. JGI-2019a]|nr:hypothetical protein FRB94_006711 [Tulasnella sp. JGI-2019a]